MAWYGNDVMPYAILVPAAIAGLLLPYLGRRVDPKLAALGTTAAFSLLSAGLTAAGLGASFVPVVWALAGLFTMTDVSPICQGMSIHSTEVLPWLNAMLPYWIQGHTEE